MNKTKILTRSNHPTVSDYDPLLDTKEIELAENPATAALERIRFLARSARHLDSHADAKPEKISLLRARHSRCLTSTVLPALNAENVHISRWSDLDSSDRERLRHYFLDQVLPRLLPQAVDAAHPFPRISPRSLNLAAVVCDPDDKPPTFVRVMIPYDLPRFVTLTDTHQTRFLFLPHEELIVAHFGYLCHGMQIIEHSLFRITSHHSLSHSSYEYSKSSSHHYAYGHINDSVHKHREVHTHPTVNTHLEVESSMSDRILDTITAHLQIDKHNISRITGLMDLSSLEQIYHEVSDLTSHR